MDRRAGGQTDRQITNSDKNYVEVEGIILKAIQVNKI